MATYKTEPVTISTAATPTTLVAHTGNGVQVISVDVHTIATTTSGYIRFYIWDNVSNTPWKTIQVPVVSADPYFAASLADQYLVLGNANYELRAATHENVDYHFVIKYKEL